MDEIKRAYAWQQSLELSKQLVLLCEKFSDVETNVLVWHLRQAVAEVPATVAADLRANRAATMEPVIKLMTILELVTKIYPGIDTDDAVSDTNQLIERMQSERFSDRQASPEEDGEDEQEHSEGYEHSEGEEVHTEDTSVPVHQVDGVSGNHNQYQSNEG